MKDRGSVVRFGVFELDVSAGELRKQGRKINLQQQPFQVLALLLRRPGELVTREELQQELWPADTFVEFDQGLNTAIKKIRQALDDSADHPRFVETLPRKGYRFIAAVNGGESGVESSPPGTSRGRRMLWAAAALALLVVAGAGGWLLNKPNETADVALVPVPLTSDPGAESWPSFSPDGNQVVFDRDQPRGRSEIRVKLVGEGESEHLAGGCCPAWSPDGRSIAFIDITGHPWFFKTGTVHDVFLTSPLGGPGRKLAEVRADRAPSLAWHPSGKWLVVTDRGSPAETDALFALSLESGGKRRLTSPPDGSHDMYPAVSPDGEALVFGRGSESCCVLYLLELSEEFEPKGELKRLTSENTYSNQAAWTPDGRAIVFASSTIHARALYEMPLSRPGWRPGKTKRLAFAAEGVRHPAISRQGRLAYATSTIGTDIWLLELNAVDRAATPPKILIDSTRLDHDPEYSPDGKRIAFASNRSGSNEIWVCNSDGSDAMRLTSLGGSFYTTSPTWSPDGRLILFRSNPEGNAETFVIDSHGGKPKLLFPNTGVSSWSHDGAWIYVEAEGQEWKKPWPPLGPDDEGVLVTRKSEGFAGESADGKVLYYARGDGISRASGKSPWMAERRLKYSNPSATMLLR